MTALSRPRFVPIVGRAVATDRPSLDLLGLAWPFSQVGLLTPEEFLTKAEHRHVRMGVGRLHALELSGLQELHRLGILAPLFRVDLSSGEADRAVDVTASRNSQRSSSTVISELYLGVAEGRVADPLVEPFQPWPTERRRALWPCVDSGYLYSRHQLLTLDQALFFIEALELHEADNWDLDWRLAPESAPDPATMEALQSWRSLAIVLSSIDTIYWPPISHAIAHDAEIWRAVRLDFDPPRTLDWLNLTRDQLTNQAEQMRHTAATHDVLGDFHDLVRRADPKAWDTLRGEARTAMDYHIAAEMLDRFAEEAENSSPPAAVTPMRAARQRLSARPRSLDAVLTGLHVSPHPSVLVGVEGVTEKLLVPRVANLLGITLDPAWIQIEEFGGTGNDLSLLARYAARPLLGEDRGDYVMLDRPPTRVLVLTDAEKKYETIKDRHYQRTLLLNSITEELPADLRPDLYARSARVVEILTWGRLPFEFAHFTDNQLADALLAGATASHPRGRAALVASIHAQRTRDPTPNVNHAWKHSGVSKVQLADALWPLLERRVRNAVERGTNGPPIMRGVLRAYELATYSPRWSTMLKRHRTPRSRHHP